MATEAKAPETKAPEPKEIKLPDAEEIRRLYDEQFAEKRCKVFLQAVISLLEVSPALPVSTIRDGRSVTLSFDLSDVHWSLIKRSLVTAKYVVNADGSRTNISVPEQN